MDDSNAANELELPFVEAELTYLLDTGVTPVNYPSVAGGRSERDTGTPAHHTVVVRNARLRPEPCSLDREGFALARHATAVGDFYDDAEIDAVYTAEVEALVLERTGAERAVVFDYTRRSDDEGVQEKQTVRGPAALVHNDYTSRSAIQRLRDILPDEADELLKQRFAIVNVWRSAAGPVYRSPVALCDGSTVAEKDVIVVERRGVDRVGEICRIAFSESHRWFYYPRLDPGEVLLIKTHDSGANGRCRFAPHAAFANPAAAPESPPRESIEARVFAFFSGTGE